MLAATNCPENSPAGQKTDRSFALPPRPASSRALNTEGLGAPDQVEIRRVRMENWRIVYAVNGEEKWVWVLSIRQRPPYDYDDLADLASMIRE